jgi:hypothetical protein
MKRAIHSRKMIKAGTSVETSPDNDGDSVLVLLLTFWSCHDVSEVGSSKRVSHLIIGLASCPLREMGMREDIQHVKAGHHAW